MPSSLVKDCRKQLLAMDERAGIDLESMPYLKGRRLDGAVAQLGERRVRNAEVRGSNPLGSTTRLGCRNDERWR